MAHRHPVPNTARPEEGEDEGKEEARVPPVNEMQPRTERDAGLARRAGYGAVFFIASAGTLVMEITAGSYALTVIDEPRRTRFLFSVVKTLSRVFPEVEVWAEVAQLQSGGRITYLVVAGDRPSPAGRIDSRVDPDRVWVRWPASDLGPQVMASDSPVLTDDYAPVDRLLGAVLTEIE